ncbi:hypothetical protein C8R46DRAFT_1080142 [Mycena filopes]|nr:hypothetical protein C8R46DRAFT_1080142 [Mycena filopes]
MSGERPATSPGPAGLATLTSASPDPGPTTPTIQKRHSTNTFTTHASTASTSIAPPRPPRNPARVDSTKERRPRKTPRRPSTATGTREEVTPWEFFPVNAPTEQLPILTSEETAKQSSATATGKREDVLPWELFPAPDYDAPQPIINGSPTQPNHSRQRRTSTSGSILSDMALLRRRKSTGTKPPPPGSYGHTNGTPRTSTSTINGSRSPTSSPKVLHKTPSSSTVRPPLPGKTSSGPVPTLSSLETISPPRPPFAQGESQDPKFSTADRAILKELKRNISARAAQFVIKGGPAESGRASSASSLMRLGTKHHAYTREEVPYPRSYAREVLDLDVWESMACQKICDSLTWHVFSTPPTKVLDIGCGTGTWILNCGMAWRDCHFVGVDVVPLHPDLGSSELSSRITWVQANFLEGLPFPNDEFDFVHIKRIALGVPEDKWDSLFEEIARVLKSGGAFELIEEDLFFPGKTSGDDEDSDSDVVSELHYARRDSSENDDNESVLTGSGGSRKSYEGSAPTPNTSLGAIPGTPPRTASPLPMLLRDEVIEEAVEDAGSPTPAKKPPLGSPAHPPHHRHSYQPRIPSLSLSLSSPGLPRSSTGSTMSLLGLGPAVTPPIPMHTRSKPRGYSTSTLISPAKSVLSIQSANPSVLSGTSTLKPGPGSGSGFSPFLLRTLPKAPPNPRDHSLLEGIYNEMNATRFINLSPLSLLANLVGLHFKDVRTHPPLQLTFPPPTTSPPPPIAIEDLTTDDESDSDDARNAIVPSPRRRSLMSSGPSSSSGPTTPRSMTFSDTSIGDENRWVNTTDLLKRESRYIILDNARMSAYSPASRSSFPAMSPVRTPAGLPPVDPPAAPAALDEAVNMKPPAAARNPEHQNRLPNSTFNIDVRTLNMHLAIRTAEILACAESMWEWVVSYQSNERVAGARGRPRAGSLASESVPHSSRILAPDPAKDSFKSAVLDLAREDFDTLLVWFELDMRDNMGIGSTLREQFSWPCIPIAPSQDRKAFSAACERWEQWEDQQKRKLKSPYERHQTRNSIDTPYIHGPEAGNHRPDVIRGRSSLPNSAARKPTKSSTAPPAPRLSRSMRVFAAWKP